MPRFPLHPASGTGVYVDWHSKVIRFCRYGCANRPFYHIVIMNMKQKQRDPPIEQLGTFDPMANQYNEKLVALNLERIQFWIGQGNVEISHPVAKLLGLCGFLPIHPKTIVSAWNNRKRAEQAKKLEESKNEENSQAAEQSN